LTQASLAPGTRIRLSGGYDFEPRWLRGRENITGTVEGFLPGQGAQPAALVRLDEPITVDDHVGAFLVLELRYVGAAWSRSNVVHLELCPERPPARSYDERPRGAWVESHATYELLASDH
jgi:hypothetical protein